MKKTKLTYLNLCLITLGLFLFTHSAITAPQPAGRVVMATSGVTAQQPNQAERQLARRAEVYVGDLIKVAEGAKTQILLQDGELLALIAKTELVIENLTYAAANPPENNANIKNLVTGGLRSISGAVKEENYQVKTRAGTIGIRGTAFETITEGGENLFVKMQEGTAYVANEHGIAEVSKDQADSAVAITNPNEAPKSMPPEDLPPSFDEAFAEDAALDAALEDELAPEDFAGFYLHPMQAGTAKNLNTAGFYKQLAITANNQQLNLAALNPQAIFNQPAPSKAMSFAAKKISATRQPFNLLTKKQIRANYWQKFNLTPEVTIYAGGQLACVSGCLTAEDLAKPGALVALNQFIFANQLQGNHLSLVGLPASRYQLTNQQPITTKLTANPLAASQAQVQITHAEITSDFTQEEISFKLRGQVQLANSQTPQEVSWQATAASLEDFYNQGIQLNASNNLAAAQLEVSGRFLTQQAEGLILVYQLTHSSAGTNQGKLIFRKN